MSTQPYDLVVRGRRIFIGSGPAAVERAGQIAVRDGRIVDVVDSGVQCVGRVEFDAGDDPIIPGLVDTHCHFRDPGYTHKETIASGTRAAALGGVTTVYDMPNTEPPIVTAERLRAHRDYVSARSVVDFGHNASAVDLEEVQALAAAGASAFKLWMSFDVERTYPHSPATALTSDADLYEAFEAVQKTGLPLYVHPTNHELYNAMTSRAKREWGMDFRSYAKAFRLGDSVVVNSAVAMLLEFQRSVGNRLHVLHVSSTEAIRMIRHAKESGRQVTAEANPFAMFVTNSWERVEERGPFALGQWVPEIDADVMWQAIVDGTIDVIGSDHAPHTREEKEPGWSDLYAAPSGSPMIADYLPLLLTAVNDGRLSLARVVELCCSAPARLVGLEGRKGTIEVGADADLVIVDLHHDAVISDATTPYLCGWTPAAGLRVSGRVKTTIVRGTVVAEGGKVLVENGFGEFLAPTTEVDRS